MCTRVQYDHTSNEMTHSQTPTHAPADQVLDECLSIRAGELWIEECRVLDLARRYGTPLYVMSEDQLRRNARRIATDFSTRWPGEFLLLPSIKANPALAPLGDAAVCP